MRIPGQITGVVLCAIIFAEVAWSQANINENLETALVYVDGTSGSDSNPGTEAKPFKTISKAAAVATTNNRKGVGTRVTINPGTYGESILLANSPSNTSLPITFEAATSGTVIVSGSDQWTGWQPYAGNSKVYRNSWPYTWGLCPASDSGQFEQPITLRREMIFVNGTMLTQVLTLNQLGLGTFFVDEVHGMVYIYPAADTNIDTADVEVSTRNALFTAYQKTNVVLRGLTFERANSCRETDAVEFVGGSNILIDGDQFNWNNADGVGLNVVTNFTVQNSVANHNGERGFRSFEAKFGQWTSNEADYANWRGAQGGIYGWAAGGFHFFAQHNNTVSGAKMLFNETHGVHWDTDDANVTADSLISAYNLRDGALVEKSEGPVSISSSYACNNAQLGLYFDGGIALRVSTYVTLNGDVLANNVESQIPIIGIEGGVPISVTNYETGQTYNLLTYDLTMTSNTVEGGAGQQLVDDFDQSGTAWTDLQSTLVSDYNTWWNGSVSQPFTVPVPAHYTTLTWPNWLSVTGQDTHSVFEQPSVDPTGPCQVTADAADFWFVDQDQGTLTVTAGTPAVYTLMLIPLGGFHGITHFSQNGVSSVPGATLSWSKTSLTGSGTVSFTVNTKSTTPTGTYAVTLAAHSGSVERTVTVALIVQ